MNKFDFQVNPWYKALTLNERIASQNQVNSQIDPELAIKAKKIIDRWQSCPWFSNSDYFAQRLEMEGITKEELNNILSQSVKFDYNSKQYQWLKTLDQALYEQFDNNSNLLDYLDNLISENTKIFLGIIKPPVDHFCNILYREIRRLILTEKDLPFTVNTIENILSIDLPKQLLKIITKTLVLEINVARLDNKLNGNTPEERFQSFIENLSKPEVMIELFKEYPVMARQVLITLEDWLNFSLEFVRNLCNDREELQKIFGKDIGKLTNLESAGDKHRSHRSVLIASFSSGFKIVYKPKSLAVDVHFQELLNWLNNLDKFLPFKTLKVLSRPTYGWVEFVEHQACNSVDEVKNFYLRQGGYLAILYILNATDFHNENLIATGENPVLIDLETLFHPQIDTFNVEQASESAMMIYQSSVLKVGLLPLRLLSNDRSEGIDLSGLGTAGTQTIPYLLPYWEATGTDEMRLQHRQMEVIANRHRPSINGIEINVLDYQQEIVTGFIQMYRLLLKHKSELLSDNSHLFKFANDEIRVVIRHTEKYGLLLQNSCHPDVLRDAVQRDQLFDSLWSEVKYRPYLAQTISAECEDLHNGDIPFFTTRPNSLDLYTSSGKIIPNFFDKPSIKSVQNLLQEISEKDLERQIWYINASLATLTKAHKRAKKLSYSLTKPELVITQNLLLLSAKKIGNKLDALAVRGKNDVTWMGLNAINEDNWSLVPSGVDLYGGLSGIVLFLAYLAELTQEQRYLNLAQAGLRSIKHQIEEHKNHIKLIGGFTGWGGIIYLYSHLATLWEQPDLLTEAQGMVELVADLIDRDEQLDIISGAAGCIPALISLYRCQPSSLILDTAIQCGQHLLAKAQTMKHGIGWGLPTDNYSQPLTGFSHGAAGIAWALLELTNITGEERFKKTALQAIAYERSLFLPEVGNWPDLRNFEKTILKEEKEKTPPTCMNAWCHGAPGIGLARLASLNYLDDADIRSEINIALKTTKEKGFGNNHSLCHGDLGNLELLLQASLILDEPYWKNQVDHFAAIILQSIETNGCLSGTPLAVETPGLMTGLAGIGYQLLRLAEPQKVPSILTLQPPNISRRFHSIFFRITQKILNN